MEHDIIKKEQILSLKVFAGKLDYENINWEDRWTLSLHYDGKTMPNNYAADFRDWDAIRDWVHEIDQLLKA